MIKRIKINFLLPVLMLALATLPSCVRYYDPPPYFENNTDTVAPLKRKVLIIGIDGAVGAEYKTIQPTVLEGMKLHSKYTYDGFSDESTTDASSWKTLMSGVPFAKHQISDSSLVYTQPQDGDEHGAIKNYPSFLNYILSSSKSDTRTTVISSWSTLMSKLAAEAENKILGVDDAAVKDSAVAKLPTSNSDIVIVHFNGVAKAGKISGFSATAQGYKDAVTTVDGYIGNIMTALKSRPGYGTKEEWLVIILGTHGGTGTTYGGSTTQEVNTVAFYYNEKFKPTELVKPGYNGAQITGKGTSAVNATIPDDGGFYNLGSTGEQTISVKIKCSSKEANWPHFFSKQQKAFTGNGWTLYTNSAGNWNLAVSTKKIEPATSNVFDNNWHTLTFKFMDSASKRWVVRYTDGNRLEATDLTGAGVANSLSSTSPLTLGWGADPGYGGITAYYADCMIFNKALTDAEVQDMVCAQDITKHPKYGNLVGYWPCNEGYGKLFRNRAPGQVNKDIMLKGAYAWSTPSSFPCTAPVGDPAKAPIWAKSLDVATTLMYWLKIPVQSTWKLDGSVWLNQYEMEFVKL
ncbi:DUF4983 domain-containing protein [Chitinophagaceae bacterium LB-8]|uniref:DUF4983 domain-containing protein n=1 Tax=Paraflavisolibacter caeni TaxID=2982496 RepID=A0A9X2XX91_9BACT|nr:LamG-like jellyroll fold domain-containing protein [Paraflavisolibacter caeni]MCU7549408.1 DUF4983 domain-containing protein [Paraflavisolibacter caeni]